MSPGYDALNYDAPGYDAGPQHADGRQHRPADRRLAGRADGAAQRVDPGRHWVGDDRDRWEAAVAAELSQQTKTAAGSGGRFWLRGDPPRWVGRFSVTTTVREAAPAD